MRGMKNMEKKSSEYKSTNKEPILIPYVAYEKAVYKLEQKNKILWIALSVAVLLLVVSVVV